MSLFSFNMSKIQMSWLCHTHIFFEGDACFSDFLRDVHTYIADMPWFIHVAGDILLAFRIADNKAVFVAVFCIFR